MCSPAMSGTPRRRGAPCAAWGLEIRVPRPADVFAGADRRDDARRLRRRPLPQHLLERFDMSLGTGLGKSPARSFRIGHLGDINDLTLLGALAGVEMGLSLAGVPHRKGGVAPPWTICGRPRQTEQEDAGERQTGRGGCDAPYVQGHERGPRSVVRDVLHHVHDRVNVGTAASAIQKELGLSNTQLAHSFSGFAYPYLIFQVIGGMVGDRFGPRRTLFACGLIWAAGTALTGLAGGMTSLFLYRVLLGFGEGATFPTATRAMQNWTPSASRGFAQGITHSFSRLGNAITPPLVAALMAAFTWRGSFVALGALSLVWVFVWLW